MFDFITNVLVIVGLIAMNSLFVSAEIAVVTSKKSRLHSLSKDNKGAKRAIELSSKPEEFLSTVQVGITLINVMIGIYSGTAISAELSSFIDDLGILIPYREEMSYFIVVLVITYLTVLGEIIPKRIAMIYPDRVASLTSYLMLFFTKLFYPLVKLLSLSTQLALTTLKIREQKSQFTMEELRIMINQKEIAGMLAETEHDLLRRIVHLSNTQVGAIMTPRHKIVWLDISDDDNVNLQKVSNNQFQSFPVIKGGVHNLIGIINFKKLRREDVSNKKIVQSAKTADVIYIPDTARVSKLIDLFKEKKERTALVVDEYGDIEGLVTLNDILKILVGNLAIGISNDAVDVIKKSEDSYVVSGNISVEELMSILEVSNISIDEDEEYRTLAGFMMTRLDKLPKAGDDFCALGWSFRIVKMDKRRIARVLLQRL